MGTGQFADQRVTEDRNEFLARAMEIEPTSETREGCREIMSNAAYSRPSDIWDGRVNPVEEEYR